MTHPSRALICYNLNPNTGEIMPKILKLILSSVVISFLWGCEGIMLVKPTTTAGSKAEHPQKTQLQPPGKEKKQKTPLGKLKKPPLEKAKVKEQLLENPLAWIAQLEKENQTLKVKLEQLTTQLDKASELIAVNPQKTSKSNQKEISQFRKEKTALEEQLQKRTQQLADLKLLLKPKINKAK